MIVLSLPEEVLNPIFQDIAISGIISDGKIWADAVPKTDVESILIKYLEEREKAGFDLRKFIDSNFAFPAALSSSFISDISQTVAEHIDSLWPYLTRGSGSNVSGSSLIPLPFPYIVPGGRFNEIYYWDSYFTMLGLRVSSNYDLICSMVDNFAWLIREVGFIPNGNRTYFLSRSQPPFFSMMVALVAELNGESAFLKYKEELLKEYQFWMNGLNIVGEPAYEHCVFLPENMVMNRYHDQLQTPRSEMYADDLHLASELQHSKESFYGHIRSACESGWDFSSRWCLDACSLSTIHTGEILPIDLNCLLYHLELTLATVMRLSGSNLEEKEFNEKAAVRKKLIKEYFWDDVVGYYFDYDFKRKKRTQSVHAAGIFPLFVGIADDDQAKRSLDFLSKNLMKDGGIATTTLETGQQWDAPNGWAPLQWIAVKASLNYNYPLIAQQIISKWTKLNDKVFKETGKMLEKYNVLDTNKPGGGGEYPVQDGFGWTNGVYLAMKDLEVRNL